MWQHAFRQQKSDGKKNNLISSISKKKHPSQSEKNQEFHQSLYYKALAAVIIRL